MKVIEPSFWVETEIGVCGYTEPGNLSPGMCILQRIERIGRTCYKSEAAITEDSAIEFVRRILRSGHESVIEHESLTVRFICDRGVSHEIVRHRLASFSMESTRYCNYGKGDDGVTFIRPFFFEDGTPEYYCWKSAMKHTEGRYLELLERGRTPQEARSVLPNSLKTEIVVTANFREWRHILRLRTSKAAHPQMRQLMVPLLQTLQGRIPVLFEDIMESS